MMKKDAAFVITHTSSKVWENFEGIPDAAKQTVVPRVLMIERWDGLMRFPGGFLEPDEEIVEGAFREVEEEIGIFAEILMRHQFDVEHPGMTIVTRETPSRKIHSIMIELSQKDFDFIIEAPKHGVKHFGTEVLGVVGVPIINYPNAPVYDRFMKRDLALFVKEDIEVVRHLYRERGMIP